MTDTELLQEKIKNSGLKMTFLAEKCGLTYQGFWKKVNNLSEFTAPEIQELTELLNLSLEEQQRIFFAK